MAQAISGRPHLLKKVICKLHINAVTIVIVSPNPNPTPRSVMIANPDIAIATAVQVPQ